MILSHIQSRIKASIKHISDRGGYTLLFAVLTAALVLGVAAFILSISRKQYILAATARESTVAIYAAYSGIECITKSFNDGTLVAGTVGDDSTNPAVVACNGGTSSAAYDQITDSSVLANFRLQSGAYYTPNDVIVYFPGGAGSPGDTCVRIKIYDGISSVDGNRRTVIDARGYNSAAQVSGFCPQNTTRTVERAFRLTYQ